MIRHHSLTSSSRACSAHIRGTQATSASGRLQQRLPLPSDVGFRAQESGWSQEWINEEWTVAVFLRTARQPCYDGQASVSAKWDGRSRAIFACSLVVGGGIQDMLKCAAFSRGGVWLWTLWGVSSTCLWIFRQNCTRSTKPASLCAVPKAHQSRDGPVHHLCAPRTSQPRANS